MQRVIVAKQGGLFKSKKTAKKASGTVKKSVSRPGTADPLWLPNTERPSWLDGSLPGDRGFDPLGLSKPVEYLQVDLDQLDQNAATNKAGRVLGAFSPVVDEVSTDSLQPYSEVFGLQRFRECELIHGRWAMLGALGALASEASTGVAWQDAIGLEYAQPQYVNFDLPFDINQLAVANSVLMGGVELLRNTSTDPETRCYPGGAFDPLNLATSDRADKLKEAEIKHGRLAMVACFGFLVQALAFGKGALGSLAQFADTF
jgi:light-harvesting complex II chlorophyll a/b binding protein 4